MSDASMKDQGNKNMVWIDLEMSGLDPEKEKIIEIATIVTDWELNVVAEGPELIIHQNDKVLNAMDDWNKKHHRQSGLWDRVLESKTTVQEAENQTLAFIKKYVPKGGILAGNSIWQDRRFMIKEMPLLDAYMNHRMIDVSSFKVIAKYWYDEPEVKKANKHRALDDIKESIEELKHYREKIFKK